MLSAMENNLCTLDGTNRVQRVVLSPDAINNNERDSTNQRTRILALVISTIKHTHRRDVTERVSQGLTELRNLVLILTL